MLTGESAEPAWETIAHQFEQKACFQSARAFSYKAAAVGVEAWQDEDGRIVTDAYIREVAFANLIDSLLPHAVRIPDNLGHVAIASGVIADGVAEGAAKPCTPFNLTRGEKERAKVASILVLSRELARSEGPDAVALFRKLLRDAVIEASNIALLASLDTTAASAGSTVVQSLQNGLDAADNSTIYTVAATPVVTRQLALASDGRMPIGGGEFSPGVFVYPALTPTSSAVQMVVIPASRIAIRDSGIRVHTAGHGDVSFAASGDSTTPTGTQLVNLWQTGSVGLIVERIVDIVGGSPAVEVS